MHRKHRRLALDLVGLCSSLFPWLSSCVQKLIMCVRDSEESMQSLAVMTVLQKWFDRMQPNIAQRHRGVKIEVKSEPTVKTEGQDAVSAAAAPSSAATSASSTFTPQFEQMVHHIVSVMSVHTPMHTCLPPWSPELIAHCRAWLLSVLL